MAVSGATRAFGRRGPYRPWLLFGATTAYWLVGLAMDVRGSLGTQLLVGLASWLLFALLVVKAAPADRVRGLCMVGVATCCEILASLVLGFYEYRLHNLPAYVPPGHGIFFMVATRLSHGEALQRGRAAVVAVAAISGVWAARGLLVGPTPDVFGALAWVALVGFLVLGRERHFYAVSFTLTMLLEFYGTWLGTWRWAAYDPVFGLPMGNPPSAIGAGYCVMDAAARSFSGVVGHWLKEVPAVASWARARLRRLSYQSA